MKTNEQIIITYHFCGLIQLIYQRDPTRVVTVVCRFVYIPPQFSSENRLVRLCATYGEIFSKSCVRTRVASSDWWASRKVVSVRRTPFRELIAFTSPLGPSRCRRSRSPGGGGPNKRNPDMRLWARCVVWCDGNSRRVRTRSGWI